MSQLRPQPLVGQWPWDLEGLVACFFAWRSATQKGQWKRLQRQRLRRRRAERAAEERRVQFARLVEEGEWLMWRNAQPDIDVLAWEHYNHCVAYGGWAEWQRLWGARYALPWRG